jgi:glucose-6-phosphate isomerase
LLPLSLAGLEIEELRRGAREARERSLEPDGPAARAAAALHENYEQGRGIHDMFVFSKELESLGKWFRQLTAESLGKDGDNGATGITPLVSVGSVDLHSMQQLYMGGPDDKVHSLVSVGSDHSVDIPSIDGLDKGPEGMNQEHLMDAIEQGVEEAFSEAGIPFIQVGLDDRSEVEVGAFLQHKMIETMILGRLLEVNAFNQPNVESYKQATRDILQEDDR